MKHTLLLIHGISDGDGPHDFDKFWQRLSGIYSELHKVSFDDYFLKAPIEWDAATSEGESDIFKACFGGIRESDKYLVHGNLFQTGKAMIDTRAWRYFSTFLIGDVVAYIDEADNKIRETAWGSMRQYLESEDGSIKPYSIIGHSLGSVIAYDFIFALMVRNKLFDFATAPVLTAPQIQSWQDGFRNLYTMGSPIGLFMMRHRDLWQNDFGNLINPVDNTSKIRTWLNLLDKDDLVAYPLEPIFKDQPGKSLRDLEVDTGMLMPWAHTQYWDDDETAKAIVSTLPPP